MNQVVWLSLLGCTDPPADPVDGVPQTPATEIAWKTFGPEAPTAQLVDVAVPRELRGLWVATVSNLDFPSRSGLPVAAMKRELTTLVERSQSLGFNALVFQVRSEGDAQYESKLEPWSRFLTGKQGRSPGLDPLAFLVETAHAHGIEVHAWFNPYRAASNRSATCADNHVSRWASKSVRPWGRVLWLDPGVPEVRDHALAVISDVLDRYDIDGVHLDDYFYPYPEGRLSFPDDASYSDYKKGGGDLAKGDWRCENVDQLVHAVSEAAHKKRPDVRFGISPFGIYRPGIPAGVRGLDQVAMLHADPLKWFTQGWIDYLAPQLYWPTTSKNQSYEKLLTWWDQQVTPERPLVVGLDLTKVGKDPAWTVAEMRKQVDLARAADRTAGQIWFRASPVLADQGGVADLLDELYARPALPPPLTRLQDPIAPPTVTVEGKGLTLSHSADRKDLRGFVLYQQSKRGWDPRRILGPGTESVDLGPGVWAVSAVSRAGVESRGVQVRVEDGSDAIAEP